MTQLALRLETAPTLAKPFLWQLEAGEPKILSLGTRADFTLAVPGMLPIAAKIYFDGQALSVAALGPGATLNGQPLDVIFRPLTLPARLRLGETAISLAASAGGALAPAAVRARYSDSETKEMSFDELYGKKGAARSRGNLPALEPGGATLIEFPNQAPASFGDQLQALTTTRADPRVSAWRAEQRVNPAPAVTPPKASYVGVLTESQVPTRPGPWRSFRDASFAKRATVVVLPFVLALFGWKAFHPAARSVALRASGTRATSSVTAAAPATDAPRVVPLETLPAIALDTRGAAASAPAVEANKPASASLAPRQSGFTLQRRAVDAFANGNFAEAAGLYQRLASENPDQAAYPVASRIANDKARGQVR